MYRKKGRGWTKHIDFMLIDMACIVIAFFISYVIRFGFNMWTRTTVYWA